MDVSSQNPLQMLLYIQHAHITNFGFFFLNIYFILKQEGGVGTIPPQRASCWLRAHSLNLLIEITHTAISWNTKT